MGEIEIPFGGFARRAALAAEIHAAFADMSHAGLQSILQASAEAVVRHLDAALVRIWMIKERETCWSCRRAQVSTRAWMASSPGCRSASGT
jgi:hypothetical protein